MSSDEKKAEAPAAAGTATAAASASPAVHPYAAALARLSSPMSFVDQEVASRVSSLLIYSSLFLSFPIAYLLENVLFSAAAIAVAGLISCVLFLPNWRQRKDPAMRWAKAPTVAAYYSALEARREELGLVKEPKKKRKVE